MSLFDKLFGKSKSPAAPVSPKPVYKHYGQRPKPDAKRNQKHGPKKD